MTRATTRNRLAFAAAAAALLAGAFCFIGAYNISKRPAGTTLFYRDGKPYGRAMSDEDIDHLSELASPPIVAEDGHLIKPAGVYYDGPEGESTKFAESLRKGRERNRSQRRLLTGAGVIFLAIGLGSVMFATQGARKPSRADVEAPGEEGQGLPGGKPEPANEGRNLGEG